MQPLPVIIEWKLLLAYNYIIEEYTNKLSKRAFLCKLGNSSQADKRVKNAKLNHELRKKKLSDECVRAVVG